MFSLRRLAEKIQYICYHYRQRTKFSTKRQYSVTMESGQRVTDEQLKEIIPDLPSGPLDVYRKKASFDWRRLKLVYETLNTLNLKNQIWNFMETHPLFNHSEVTLPLDEERHIATKRMYSIFNENFLPLEKASGLLVSSFNYIKKDAGSVTTDPVSNIMEMVLKNILQIAEDPRTLQSETEALFMFDSSLAVKLSLTFRMFTNMITGSGRSHHYPIVEAVERGEIGGCFALTEVAHGSNAKGMRTTATYVPEKRQFVMHSADFEAAKCWVGSLGKCATHAIIYAMLISKGKNHGLHAFVIPIRDPKTLKPYPGVVVGDIGEKIGLNGVDNGFVMFNNYHVPKEAALDKLGGVDDHGDYQSPIRDPNKRFGASLGILSGGRVQITCISTNYLVKAMVIAIRYSAVRKQFGPENAVEETPVLEYQQQQIKLLPHLATAYAMKIFSTWLSQVHVTIAINNMMGVSAGQAAARGLELHALSSGAKPLLGWAARDGIQHAREGCGGHGYLKAACLGELRNDNDANCTYEGENGLLVQQTSNWLLTVWPRRKQAKDMTPLGTLRFLEDADRLLTEKCPWTSVEDMIEPKNLIHTYQWLTTFVLKMTYEKVSELKSAGKSNLEAKNESQSYNAITLSLVYAENFILNHFYETSTKFEDPACRNVLLKLVALYGAFLLEKHMATHYIGGYLSGRQGVLLREGVVRLCADLVPDAVALVDSIAPPDFCIRSVLGRADGQVYKHIQNSVMSYPESMSRPTWWRDVVHWRSYVQAKL